jgi:hypothetical protein
MNPDLTSLDRLHDIITPPPASWWPPAPGWYLVIGLAAWLAGVAAVRGLRSWRRNCYRREAISQMRRLQSSNTRDKGNLLRETATILKRAALSAWPRKDVASLTGPAWWAWWRWLDQAGNVTVFSSGLGELLERAAYDQRSAADLDDRQLNHVFTAVRNWLSHHRVERVGC